MRRNLLLALALFACGHGNDPSSGTGGSGTSSTTTVKTGGSGSAETAPTPGSASGSAVADTKPDTKVETKVDTKPAEPPPPPGHDFTATALKLLTVGACGPGQRPEGVSEDVLKKHCEGPDGVKAAQQGYLDKWFKPADAFFRAKVPANLPKKVVYPFAGGDLSTALTVYPDADEITTMSLEPAGDPRTLDALTAEAAKSKSKGTSPKVQKALGTIAYELKFLYRVNFSNTLNMIDAMRGGGLPTNLVFSLSALMIHGYEVTAVRYFRLEDDGSIHYLDDAEVAAAPDPLTTPDAKRNRIFANEEIRFKKPGGRTQIYRHIQVNLGNDEETGGLPPLKKDMRIIKHLESKGQVAAMTKAASYLLSWESFSIMRDYLLGHAEWMVSDATGIAPKWGKAKGFEYETYGGFSGPHIPSGGGVAKDWRAEFSAQPKRELKFRFGYYDKDQVDHLVIMKKKS